MDIYMDPSGCRGPILPLWVLTCKYHSYARPSILDQDRQWISSEVYKTLQLCYNPSMTTTPIETKEEYEAREIHGQTKVCSICKVELPKTKFSYSIRERYSAVRGRYQYWTIKSGCRECTNKKGYESYVPKSNKKRKHDPGPTKKEQSKIDAAKRREERKLIKKEKKVRRVNGRNPLIVEKQKVKGLIQFFSHKKRCVISSSRVQLTGIYKEADDILRWLFYVEDHDFILTPLVIAGNMLGIQRHCLVEEYKEALEEFYYLFWASEIPNILIEIVEEQNRNKKRNIFLYEEEKK